MMMRKRKLGAEANAAPASGESASPAKDKVSSPHSQTPGSGTSGRSVGPAASRVASSVFSAATASRRPRRGSIVYEAARVESKHFNAKELQNLAKQFNTWTNKQNMMDREGFRKSLGLLGMVQDALLCHQLFRVFNKSGSGQIDFEEYVEGLGVLMKGTMDEKLDFSFNMTDIDGSGEISFEELLLTVDSMMRIYAGIMGGQSSSTVVDKEKIRRVFAHLDKNNDGKITMEEYKNGMKKHPEFLNTLRGTDIFRPLSNSSSSFRAANLRAEKLETALSAVLQEVYRAEDALIALRMMETTAALDAELNGVTGSNRSSPIVSSSRPAEDLPDDDEKTNSRSNSREGAYNEEDYVHDRTEAMHELLSALAKAKSVCETHCPSSARSTKPSRPISASKMPPRSDDSEELRRSKTITVSAPTTPISGSGSPEGFNEEEEEKTAEPENAGPDAALANGTGSEASASIAGASPLPAPPPLRNDTTVEPTEATTAALDEFAAEDTGAETLGLPPLPGPSNRARKGLIVYFGHKNWDLVVNVMKGIQMAVSRSAMEQDRPVSVYDFGVKEKYTLVSSMDPKAEKSKDHRTRFVDYAPFVFAKLRDHFHIDHEEYMNSIGPGSMLSNLMLGSLSSLAEMGSEGKSGSFFYLSSDNRFLVKTVRKDEHKLLRHILPSYFRHMTKTGNPDAPDSMLTRIVGCHVVRTSKRSKTRTGAQKVYFVVMTNALETDLEVNRKYDLKGSWIGRRTSPAGREDPGKTLKDCDLTEGRDRIFVDGKMKQMLMASLRRDASFLESHHIIDYSVLLGVHDHTMSASSTMANAGPPARLAKEMSDSSLVSKSKSVAISAISSVNSFAEQPTPEPPFFAHTHGGFRSLDNKQTYFMGIIDFLTQYGERKRLERFVKTIAHLNSSGLSVMPARAYAKRFLNFMDKRVIVADSDRTTYFDSMESTLSTDLRHPRLDD